MQAVPGYELYFVSRRIRDGSIELSNGDLISVHDVEVRPNDNESGASDPDPGPEDEHSDCDPPGPDSNHGPQQDDPEAEGCDAASQGHSSNRSRSPRGHEHGQNRTV